MKYILQKWHKMAQNGTKMAQKIEEYFCRL